MEFDRREWRCEFAWALCHFKSENGGFIENYFRKLRNYGLHERPAESSINLIQKFQDTGLVKDKTVIHVFLLCWSGLQCILPISISFSCNSNSAISGSCSIGIFFIFPQILFFISTASVFFHFLKSYFTIFSPFWLFSFRLSCLKPAGCYLI